MAKANISLFDAANAFDFSQPVSAPKVIIKTEPDIYSVAEYISKVNKILQPAKATIQGELGRVTYRGKAVYFSVSDKSGGATIDGFIWLNRLNAMGLELKQGMEVQLNGYPSIYAPTGRISLQVSHINPVGEGALKLALEALKKKLLADGYFAPERKKPIPRYPHHIGLITADGRDAYKDFLTHVGSFGVRISFIDVRVEGINAIDNVVEAIRWFNENLPTLDVIVITRGGGSLESLAAFNSEDVAKVIFSSKIPVVSAIGHENDISISDLVADLRASTPTDAGKCLSEHWRMAEKLLQSYDETMTSKFKLAASKIESLLQSSERENSAVFEGWLRHMQTHLDGYDRTFDQSFQGIFKRMQHIEQLFSQNTVMLEHAVKNKRTEVQQQEIELARSAQHWYKSRTRQVADIEARLTLSDPTHRLKQGYSIVKNKKGAIVKSGKQVSTGDILEIQVYEGKIESKVEHSY